MAEAALVKEMQVPNGGIADFVMSDEDIETVYGPDEDGAEEYGTEGLGQFTEVANQMAAKGRYGDDTIAHLESGELVIPRAFLEQDPEMAKTLFAYLERMGVEDPQRYVVGSDANSINPETGLPEFGFFKSVVRAVTRPVTQAVKSVAKTVSSVAKPVIKIIQKAAPIVLPMVLSATPLGPVFGGALGSGIASLINGGSLKDAFKKALIGGALGAVGAGFKGLASPDGSFFGGISDAVSNPMARFSQTLTGAQNSLTRLVGGAVAPDAPGFFGDFIKPVDSIVKPSTATQQALQSTGEPVSTESVRLEATTGTNVPPATSAATTSPSLSDADLMIQDLGTVNTVPPVQPYQRPSMIESLSEGNVSEAVLPSGPTAEQVKLAKNAAYTDAYNNAMTLPGMTPQTASAAGTKAAEAVTASSMGPSIYNQIARGLALPAAGLAFTEATGITNLGEQFFTPAPQEEAGLVARDDQGNVVTGETIVRERPQDYLVSNLGQQVYNPATGQYELVQNLDPRAAGYANYVSPTSFNYDIFSSKSTPGGPFQRPDALVAEGGAIFPRRNGGIMPNEGVPGKDSVRAMLMPGEFVMTTDAVRGAGGGNLNRGINNMYTVMRNLESRGRRMA